MISQTGWGRQGRVSLFFGQIFPENCMKMKEIGPRGGYVCVPDAHLDPPMIGSRSNEKKISLFA